MHRLFGHRAAAPNRWRAARAVCRELRIFFFFLFSFFFFLFSFFFFLFF
jgi:hypothetical protein